jgi:formylglycine-generating enzyme required for sulfatase activity
MKTALRVSGQAILIVLITSAGCSKPSTRSAGETVERKKSALDPVLDGEISDAGIVLVNWGAVNGQVTTMLPELLYDFTNSTYMQSLREYKGAGASAVFAGSYSMSGPVPPTIPEIGQSLADAIVAGTLPAPTCSPVGGVPQEGVFLESSAIYLVNLPPGATVPDDGGSCAGWCGVHWHGFLPTWTDDCLFTFILIPDHGPGSGCDTICNVTNAGMINDYTTSVTHELIETITNPYQNGVTFQGLEIGDLCDGTAVNGGQGFTFMPASNGPPWFVQLPWSQAANACVFNAPWNADSYKSSGFATTRTPEHMNVFSTTGRGRSSPSGTVVASWWDCNSLGGTCADAWTELGDFSGSGAIAPAKAPVAVVSPWQSEIDVFVAGNNWQIERSSSSGRGQPFRPIVAVNDVYAIVPGNTIAAVAQPQAAEIDLYFADITGKLVNLNWAAQAPNNWGLYYLSGSSTVSALASVSAISRAPFQIDVFAADVTGTIQWVSIDERAGAVNGPFPIPGSHVTPGTQIAAVARWPWHMDIFAAGDDGSVQSYWWDQNINGGNWNTVFDSNGHPGLMPAGTTVKGASVAVALQGQSHMDVFTTLNAPAANAQLTTAWWDDVVGGSWHQYTVPTLKVFTSGQPLHALSLYRGALDVFALQPNDGSVIRTSWRQGGAWTTVRTVEKNLFVSPSSPSCPEDGQGTMTCGGGDSCCTSLEVPAGTFYRNYGPLPSGGVTGEDQPATLSGLQLDKYEVTVGRFRQFVAAWNGGAGFLPAAGSGTHTHLNGGQGLAAAGVAAGGAAFEPGWVTSDNQYVAPTSANLQSCAPSTWTDTPGSQENLPINCVNWYEAYAFCIWDGGFLPSDAEREYATAGGDQQREFAWGWAGDPFPTNQYAVHDCNYPAPNSTCADLGSIAPVGSTSLGAGRWGQMDLSGNMFDWNLDWYTAGAYVDPCTDCFDARQTIFRVVKGGSFSGPVVSLMPPARAGFYPALRTSFIGFRCARAP